MTIGSKLNKICDICGDEQSIQYRIWHSNDEYNGMELCSKHYTQLRKHGEIKDKHPSSHITKEDRACCVCGSKHHVIYHEGKYYCLRHYSQIKNLGSLKEITVFDRNEYYIEDNIAYIILRNSKNESVAEVKVDTEDLNRVIQYKWRLNTWGYAENTRVGLMQRFILNEYESKKNTRPYK